MRTVVWPHRLQKGASPIILPRCSDSALASWLAGAACTGMDAAVVVEAPVAKAAPAPAVGEASALSEHLGKMMGDAPFCNLCGHTTVRNGVCYKCLNCGNTLGCS